MADPEAFRAEVRAWLDANAPAKGGPGDFSAAHIVSASTREAFAAKEHAALATSRAWQRRLFDAGWAARSWDPAHGGHGRPAWEDRVVAEEQTGYGVSTKVLSIALEMVPPVLQRHGTEEQRRAHLPAIARGDEAWCQLLSEPDAGSDLTAVTTFAAPEPVTDCGGWRVSGQKVWTSGAMSADVALLLARTDRDRPGRDGVSCFALRMDQPGVEVRPLRQISGAFHFNEVFLDGARLEPGALIGGLGEGFAVLRTMLASERSAIGGGTSARSFVELRALVSGGRGRVGAPGAGGAVGPADAAGRGGALVRQEVARAHTRERLLDLLLARGDAVPAIGSLAKLAYSDHAGLTASAALDILGPAALVHDGADRCDDGGVAQPWLDRFLFAPGLRLGGGTDEIQRTTIAERALGLPRDPRPSP